MKNTEIRELWLKERPLYEDLITTVEGTLRNALRARGLSARVTSRVKDTASLVKKAIRKQYSDPITMTTDKAGIRVVVQFLDQIAEVHQIIVESFQVHKVENKIEDLGLDRLGYQSVHFDISLRPRLDGEHQTILGRNCEIQVRTLCQDVFAEMAHKLVYKNSVDLPNELIRMNNCLCALLEVSDREFQSVWKAVSEIKGASLLQLLDRLEHLHYQFSGDEYDRELSGMVLGTLMPLWSKRDPGHLGVALDTLCKEHAELIEMAKDMYSQSNAVFLTQPEVFLLFLLLQEDPFSLRELWVEHYPEGELEAVARAWGKPLPST